DCERTAHERVEIRIPRREIRRDTRRAGERRREIRAGGGRQRRWPAERDHPREHHVSWFETRLRAREAIARRGAVPSKRRNPGCDLISSARFREAGITS